MANAMLKENYRLSHDNLVQCDQPEGQQKSLQLARPELQQYHQQQPQEQQQQMESSHHDSRKMEMRTERRRSVVTIQLPVKKQKQSEPITLGEVMNALVFSVSQTDRLEAAHKALLLFDHQDQDTHNKEIQARADIALVKQLTLVTLKLGSNNGPIQEDIIDLNKEISMTCEALEMVLRASSEYVAVSFDRVGRELLQVITTLLDNELRSRAQAVAALTGTPDDHFDQLSINSNIKREDQDSTSSGSLTPPLGGNLMEVRNPDQDSMLQSITKVLGHFARVGAATQHIAQFPGLIVGMLGLIKMRPYHVIPWKARLSCLWTIANLACNTENMQMMVCTSGLVKTLVNIISRPLKKNESLETTMEVVRSWSIASRAILNLSWPAENKSCLAENLELVDALSELMVRRDSPLRNSKTVRDILVQARQHAVGAIRNLSAAPMRAKVDICEFKNGKVLDALTDAALGDNDQRVKDLCFAAIHNLATHETARIMVARPALILALKNVLLADEEREPDSPRDHVSSTLLVLERSITSDMSSYNDLRALLDAANLDFASDNESDGIDPSRTIAV